MQILRLISASCLLRHPPGVVDRGGAARAQGDAPESGRGAEGRGSGPVEVEGGGTVLGRDHPGQGRGIPRT